MADDWIAVSVAKDLEELIPTYMTNRVKEAVTLRAALKAGDLVELQRVGQRMMGSGDPYGFKTVSTLGRQLADDAKAGNRRGLEKRIADYSNYLTRVRIVYK